MIFKSKYKKAGSDLYEAIGEIYRFLSNEITKIDELKGVVIKDELFTNELLFLLLFFSTVKVKEYFNDKVVSNRILDELHNHNGLCYTLRLGGSTISWKVIREP